MNDPISFNAVLQLQRFIDIMRVFVMQGQQMVQRVNRVAVVMPVGDPFRLVIPVPIIDGDFSTLLVSMITGRLDLMLMVFHFSNAISFHFTGSLGE